MCGIAGVLDPRRADDGEGLARLATAMAQAIAHRGPDAGAVWVDAAAGLALGHRRLAIVDLSEAGAQPMLSACGRFALAYNGELYNTEDMRADPALAEVRWRGRSDTEVIVESIAHRGLDATLADMNGMFALALWDRRTRSLALVRDRLGIKPLFFATTGGAIAFGSELKALRAAQGPAGIDPSALAAYLRYGYVPAPHAIFSGVEKVLPGEVVRFVDGRLIARARYWSLAEVIETGRRTPFELGDDAAVDALDRLLSDAVARQMISDVPIGAFLSGGVDSSLVTALMARAGKGAVRSFSIGFPDIGFDESAHAEAVARHIGTEHVTFQVDGREAIALAPQLAEMYDEPFADSSQIPTHLLARVTRGHVTVALSGDGGDELFAGYRRYIYAGRVWPRVERIPRPLRAGVGALLGRLPPGLVDPLARVLPGAPAQLGDKLVKLGGVLGLDSDGIYGRLTSLIPDPAVHIAAAEALTPLDAVPGLTAVEGMRYRDTMTYLPDDILHKVDRATMAVALEARPPLLDHRVVDFAWRLPERLLLREGRSKWLLRRVLDRYVPRDLIERPKMGFGVPLADWLRGPLKDWAGDLLLSPGYGGGLLATAPARALFEEHQTGRRNHAYSLWTLAMFESWRRRWG